jgi:putative transposase
MPFDPDKHHRRSIRLQGADYSNGCYFVTICTDRRRPLFGEINDNICVLSPIGRIAETCWIQISHHLRYVQLDAFVFMPNHVHGILYIDHTTMPETERQFGQALSGTLATVVGSYKSAVTKNVNQTLQRQAQSLWQRGYHETIIRTQEAYDRIKEYIVLNPERWFEDEENPERRSR